MSYFNFNISSLNSGLGAVATQTSNALSFLRSKSILEHTTDVVSKTVQTARSIPTYINYSFEGAKYMRYTNTLIPGMLFVGSGISFAIYAHKIDSRSQKIAAYLLAAASITYGAIQIVDYFDITSCIGQEIKEKTAKVNDPKTSFVANSLEVKYDSKTQKPMYSAQQNTGEINTVSSRCLSRYF